MAKGNKEEIYNPHSEIHTERYNVYLFSFRYAKASILSMLSGVQ